VTAKVGDFVDSRKSSWPMREIDIGIVGQKKEGCPGAALFYD
jgi:hypothetical protein